jgi:DNA polymerase elongation subunit (family B)
LYGLDIETDTRVDGLDPSVAAVVSVAVAGEDHGAVFEASDHPDDERTLLHDLDRHLAGLDPGILVTWNGSGFDLPFLGDRAARHGLALGLHLQLDPGLRSRREPLAGHEGAYRARWHHHRHLDAYRVYRADVGPLLGISCGLKNVARAAGLRPVEVDRAALHELPAERLRTYVTSDARVTRLLAARRWPGIAAHVDRYAAEPVERRPAGV